MQPPRKQAGQKFSAIERIDKISEVQELMNGGVSSVRAIAQRLNVSNETAAEYRKLALHSMKIDGSRENVRALQFNRLNAELERIGADVEKARADQALGKTSWQTVAALLNAASRYHEQVNRIMGLNTEVSVNLGSEIKPLVILRAEQS